MYGHSYIGKRCEKAHYNIILSGVVCLLSIDKSRMHMFVDKSRTGAPILLCIYKWICLPHYCCFYLLAWDVYVALFFFAYSCRYFPVKVQGVKVTQHAA